MIPSRTILPYTFTYLPFTYYANNLSICEDIYKFKNLIELNNIFYSILESNNPEEKAKQFILNFNELSPELSPDIIIKYINLYNRLPSPIRLAGIIASDEASAGGGGAGTTTTTPPPGGGGGGSNIANCNGSDQISLLAREDYDDTREWQSPIESEGIREYLQTSLNNTAVSGAIKELEINSSNVEIQQKVDALLQAEKDLGVMPDIITWIPEYNWNKLSLASKRNSLTLAVEQQFIDNGLITEEQLQAERKSEIETGGETLAAGTHNVPGVEKSRRLAVAVKNAKEDIRAAALNRGGKCNDIDEFHFRFNPNSLSQRLLDNPVGLQVDDNPDTHEDDAKTIKSRSGKRIPVWPDKNYDIYTVKAWSRDQEKKFSEVERSPNELPDGPITGDTGTKTNKNTTGGITDPKPQ